MPILQGKSWLQTRLCNYSIFKHIKRFISDTPVMIGGIEASLRRVTHYDYWKDKLMPSILFDSRADALVYGMGDQPLRDALRLLKKGCPLNI